MDECSEPESKVQAQPDGERRGAWGERRGG